MSYADQQMSGNRVAAFIVVALLHLVLGYALVTGLAYEGMKQIAKKLTTVEIKKEEKKEEKKPPPPPKKIAPPPIVVPPPRVQPKSPSPKGNPGNWVTTNDYPTRAQREEREGVTGYRLTVDAGGKVADCQVTSSSGSPDLDEAACANLRRRARFNAATDGEGQPTTGVYSGRVRWQLPEE